MGVWLKQILFPLQNNRLASLRTKHSSRSDIQQRFVTLLEE